MNGEVFDAIGKGIAADILYGFRNGGLGDVLQHRSMRNTVGIFGMLALLAVCVSPFAIMAVNYLGYKLTAAAVRAFGCRKLASLTDCIGSAIGMVLGLAGCCAIILFVSMAISIKAVGG